MESFRWWLVVAVLGFAPMRAFCCVMAFAGLAGIDGQTWPVALEASPDTLPNIEIRLAPPVRPLPQVATEIGILEKSRHTLEEAQFSRLQSAFNLELERARDRISDIVGRALQRINRNGETGSLGASGVAASVIATHFIGSTRDGPLAGDGPSVRVTVLPAVPPDPAQKTAIDELERRRSNTELGIFEQAIAEMNDLSQFVMTELEGQLHLNANILLGRIRAAKTSGSGNSATFMAVGSHAHLPGSKEGLPKQLNVRVGSSGIPYPTISSLVHDMEKRRDMGESLARERILELELKLITSENAMIKDALRLGVARALAQYAPAAM